MKHTDFSKTFLLLKTLRDFPRTHLVAVTSLAVCFLLSFSVMTPSNEPAESLRKSQAITLALLDSSLLTAPERPTLVSQPEWKSEFVKPGDNLSLIFQRVGLPDSSLIELISDSSNAKQLTRLYPGQELRFQTVNQKLLQLIYQKDRLNSLQFTRTTEGFTEHLSRAEPDILIAYREATIVNSLFIAGTDAGLEESLVMELANIFAWDIDFVLDIRTNDSFKVLYEEKFLDGEKLGNGDILAAEFTNQGKTYRAVRYIDKDGNGNYYTPEGESMRKAFLRTPVDFARISSHFNLRRKHPILNKIRAHKGTDYAAPTGTPIKAAGEGRVIQAGVKGGYGKTVVIQHGQKYKTLYAHMSKYGRGIRSGTRVKQGQIIGYVGSSGLATGPHLHYEFYANGVVRNPVSVALPKAESVPKSKLHIFIAQTQPIVTQLDEYGRRTQVALSENSDLTRY
ncbi:MAG: murein DD-endopeptidase MepM/ murein hydrolase activator NlpD [Cellvibrionaceae bacterium]|jgi:murein DD-endopeptidase MepM/ murein hydrolase activator NlpD